MRVHMWLSLVLVSDTPIDRRVVPVVLFVLSVGEATHAHKRARAGWAAGVCLALRLMRAWYEVSSAGCEGAVPAHMRTIEVARVL